MDTVTKSNSFILKWINEIFGTLYFNCPKRSIRSKSYPMPFSKKKKNPILSHALISIIKFSTLLGLGSPMWVSILHKAQNPYQ